MSYNMDWQAEEFSVYDDEQDPGPSMGGYPAYSGRPYYRPGPQEFLPYDEEPRQFQQWSGSTRPRSLEERITVPSSRNDRQSFQARPPQFSSNGTNDRDTSHAIERSATNPTTRKSVGTIRPDNPESASRKREDAQSQATRMAASEKPSNLDDLKAKVIASMHKSREENSSTPSKDTASNTNKPTGTAGASDLRYDTKQTRAPSQTPAMSKDSRTDIDALLAEGKAAAEAGGKANHQTNTNKEGRSTKQETYNNNQTATAEKSKAIDEVGKLQNHKTEDDGKEAKSASNGDNRESSGPSEQGEIVENQEPTSMPPQRDTKEGSKDEGPRGNARSSTTNNSPAQTRNNEPNAGGNKASAKPADPKPPAVAVVERRVSEPDKFRKGSIGNTGRNVSLSGRSQVSSEDLTQPREGRPLYAGRSIRSYSDVEASPRDGRKVRPLDEPDRALDTRREYGPRVIEIVDGDDAGPPPLRNARGALERKEPGPRPYEEERPRRYEEEQPRKGVIHLSDAYWTDLEDWLDFTGYHDRLYRKEALQRHRELVALDIRRASLTREAKVAQEERAYIARAQSVQPRESLTAGATRSGSLSQTVRSTSVFDMPPPPIPIREGREVIRRIERDDREAAISVRSDSNYLPAAAYRDDEFARVRYIESPALYADPGILKRSYRSDLEDVEQGPSEKLVRVNSLGRGAARESDEVSHRPMRPLTGEEDRRARAIGDSAERRFTNEFPDARDDEGVQRAPRGSDIRGRPASPLAGTNRDRVRSLSPLPRMPTSREEENKAKVTRTDAKSSAAYSHNDSPASKRQEEGDVRPSSRQGRYRHDIRDSDSERGFRGDNRGSYQQRSDRSYQPYPYPPRGRGRGRGSSYHHRGDTRTYNHNQRYLPHQDMPSRTLDLSRGGVRYFIVKSFNTQNVSKAQEENVWATQEKNEEIFNEAFNTCRHVILFFSINKSMAFQGYARMESAPGTAEPPSWTKGLLWKSSGPFHIRWITIADTRFSRVGHLKNALNEHQAVLVGRDGQEVDGRCGAALCELIDEEGNASKW